MSMLERVRELSDEVSGRALETERARSVPTDLARKIGATGAFRLFVPESLGGAEVDPMTACEVVEEISRADGSTGWTAMILNTTVFSCWLQPSVTRAMLEEDPELGIAGIFSPIGRTEPAGDGAVRLSGRFPFNSGSPHASWFCQGALVASADGQREWQFLFVPRRDVTILDTWYAAGLRGTASHDVTIDGALVPRERMARPMVDKAPHDEPHFRWSFFSLLGALMSGVPLGIARRSLDELVALAKTKSRTGDEPLAAEQAVQLDVAQCEASLRAARSSVMESISRAWETSLAGDEVTGEEKLAIRLSVSNAMRCGIEVVDTALRLAGGGALYDDSPLQRCWRDLHAARNHIFFSNNQAANTGRVLLGQPSDESQL
ncbi:MAG: acyl-CoA dehydrogenase family protein [Myxococcales bacterium]|nr:acyl-CoA dehydrogenase family protein [Myxococcales bacterium]